jgi:hypothetical protein
MKLKDNVFVFLVFFIFFFQFNNYSQTFRAEIEALSRDADVIITGKVTKQQSEWNRDKTRIVTYTTVKAEEYLKGNIHNSFLIVSHPGGEVDGVGEIYSHMPTFKDDEEVLLFLKNDKKGNQYRVLYGEKGKIAIMNSKSGEKLTALNVPVKMLKAQIQKYTNRQ